MIPNEYYVKTYAGLLGMNIGIRLGAPVEPSDWTSDRIERFYGDIRGYVKSFKNFAADDDVNGPVYFLRALYDDASERELTAQDVANAWLNYTREGVGMFWWGGYGVSTEHTAYLNLKEGILAPQSGSALTNGLVMSEQIGGQIFIDTWGLVFPGNISKASEYASKAASVSHDGNGIYGAAFIAACISAAYYTSDVTEIIAVSLAQIPEDSTYAKVVRGVIDFHKRQPEDYKACLKYLQENWGYDKYPGVCHIIPNAGVCVLSMLYGNEFSRSVEIATMCGWDTDCNAGNVGTIIGVAGGLEGIGEHYRKPINDSVVLSGISGYLNILDLPTYTKEIVNLGYRLANQSIPEVLKYNPFSGDLFFDFELPGSTHNFRLSNQSTCNLRHSTKYAHSGTGSLEILFDKMSRGQSCKIYYKPFYRRDDFDDERYMPVFSPTAYSGQEVSFWVYVERYGGESIIINPYVRNTFTKTEVFLGGMIIKDEGWKNISFKIPDLEGAMVDEIGVLFEANSPAKNKDFGCLYLDDFSISGKADFKIDITKQRKEFASITPFSHNHGAWGIENGLMEAMCLEHAEAMTGNYYTKDVWVKGQVTPHTGNSHLISARVQGALRGYYAGFTEDGVAIFCNNHKMEVLKSSPYIWAFNQTYTLEFRLEGSMLELIVDGVSILKVNNSVHQYGMMGYAMYDMGRCGFGDLEVKVL